MSIIKRWNNWAMALIGLGLGLLLPGARWALLAVMTSLLAISSAMAFTPVTGQTYILESRGNNGMVLMGEKLWSGDPQAVAMHRFFERQNQMWRFESLGGGYYKVICVASPTGEVLTMVNPGKKRPRYADTLAWTSSTAQQWQLVDLGGGWTGLKVRDTGKMLTGVEDPLYPYPSSVWNLIPESTQDTSNHNQYWRIPMFNPLQVNSIAVPQTGWSPLAPKAAVLSLTNNSSYTPTFTVSGPQTLSGSMLKLNGTPGQDWKYNMATCTANLTPLVTPGNYTITVNSSLGSYSAPFEIAGDVYRNVRGETGIVSVPEMFAGFWLYNTVVGPEILTNVSVQVVNNATVYLPVGGTFTLTKGWYDASSRDVKVARDAVAMTYMMLGVDVTDDPTPRATLLDAVCFGVDFLLEAQSSDGSWPVGKVKDTTDIFYYTYCWDVNTYVGTTARAVAALAMAAQTLYYEDVARASAALAAAQAGWSYVMANYTDANFQGPEEVSFRGTSGGVLCAAVELYRATGHTAYRDFAENMISNGWFNATPAFVGISTPFPGQVDNAMQELESGLAIVALCRHRPFASGQAMAAKIDTEANNWRAAWANKFIYLPWGIPNTTVNQGFGPNVAHSFLAVQHLLVAQAFPSLSSECLARGSKLYDHLTGFNPFSTSFITGFGYWNSMPGHGRAREDTIGMVQPGYLRFGSNLANTLLAEFAEPDFRASYRMTEGMITESAALFPILGLLDVMQGSP